MQISIATAVVLLISGTNLCYLAYALFPSEQVAPDLQLPRIRLKWAAPLSIVLAFLSQALYLLTLAAWVFHWARFYPGAPINRTIPIGLAISFFGLVSATLGTGERRWVSFMVSITTAFLWILAAVASVAV